MEKGLAGIDISEEKLDVSLRPVGQFFQVRNDEDLLRVFKWDF